MEKVSVIIPCYNSGRTIIETVESIKKQTWSNIDLIIVNDGSDDHLTKKVLSNLTNARIINKKNSGLSSARNEGIKNSKGNFILFLDADDWIEINAISEMMECMKKTKANIVFCDTFLEGESQGVRKRYYNFFEQLFVNHIPYCLLIKKEIFKKVGNYDEGMKLGYEDWEFNIRLAKNGLFPERIKQPLFHYRVTKNGMLNSISKSHHFNIFSYIQRKHKTIYRLTNVFKIYLKWRKKKMNYNVLIYVLIYFFSNIFPTKLCNYILGLITRLKFKNYIKL